MGPGPRGRPASLGRRPRVHVTLPGPGRRGASRRPRCASRPRTASWPAAWTLAARSARSGGRPPPSWSCGPASRCARSAHGARTTRNRTACRSNRLHRGGLRLVGEVRPLLSRAQGVRGADDPDAQEGPPTEAGWPGPAGPHARVDRGRRRESGGRGALASGSVSGCRGLPPRCPIAADQPPREQRGRDGPDGDHDGSGVPQEELPVVPQKHPRPGEGE